MKKCSSIIKVAATLLLSATVLFTGCTALSDGISGGEIETGDGARFVNGSKRNVIYVRTEEVSTFKSSDYSGYDFVCVAFAKASESGSISGASGYGKKLKDAGYKNKVLISFGGGGDQGYAIYKALKNNLETTASNLASIVNSSSNGYDGVDLDWEYFSSTFKGTSYFQSNGSVDSSKMYKDCNKLYKDFTASLKKKLSSGKIITAAVQTSSKFYDNSDTKEMFKNLEFINLMTYDYHYDDGIDYTGDFEKTKSTVKAYKNIINGLGYSASKLNIGLPFYGIKKNSSKETISYDQIYNAIGSHATDSASYSQSNGVAYYKSGSTLYTFDNATTIKTKLKWAFGSDIGCGGVMAWDYHHDKEHNKLREAVKSALKSISGSGSDSGSGGGSGSGGSTSSNLSYVKDSSSITYTFDIESGVPAVASSKDTSSAEGTLYYESGSTGKHITGQRISETNNGSLKLSVREGRYPIDIFVKVSGCGKISTGPKVSFKTRIASGGTIQTVKFVEFIDNDGVSHAISDTEHSVGTSFKTITCPSSLYSAYGWVHIQYYANKAVSGEAIYIDDLKFYK